MVRFTIPGEPVPKGRPRVTKTGHVYTPQNTRDYEEYVKHCYKGPMLEGQIRAYVDVFLQIPKSASQAKKKKMLMQIERPTKRPDLDNLAKTVLDAINGLGYKDDSQVVSLRIDKYWSENPRIEVNLREIGKEEKDD